jgi:ribosomal protein S18 acetylase RimI-like enzyme
LTVSEVLTINKGLGSMLLNALIDIAKKRNINRITGEIARVDIGHIERLIHFYEKHNFEVILCSNPADRYKIGDLVWNTS